MNFIVEKEDILKIDEMYEEIKSKINGKLGCVCIYLNRTYNSELRKKFIESGKFAGFSNVQIIDWNTSTYLNSVFQTNYIPKNGDIIWIFRQNECYIWQKTGWSAKLMKCVKTTEEMKAIINSGSVTAPDIIIYDDRYGTYIFEIRISEIQNFLPKCKFFGAKYSEWTLVEGALIKARILEMDSDVLGLDADTQLLRGYKIEVNGEEVMKFDAFSSLPIEKTAMITSEFGATILEVRVNLVMYLLMPIKYKF